MLVLNLCCRWTLNEMNAVLLGRTTSRLLQSHKCGLISRIKSVVSAQCYVSFSFSKCMLACSDRTVGTWGGKTSNIMLRKSKIQPLYWSDVRI